MIKYFNNNNKLVISHIEDIDGMGSIILANIFWDKQVDYVACTIPEVAIILKEVWQNYEEIYICDLPLDNEAISLIDNNVKIQEKIKHFDHHASELDNAKKYSFINEVVNLNNKQTSGTELFYNYLLSLDANNKINQDYFKEFVEATRSADVWDLESSLIDLGRSLGTLHSILGPEAYISIFSNNEIKEHFYIMTEILTKIRPGSGIGSSAASSAAAVYALNILLGKPFTDEKLVDFAMEGERLISGTAHADNVGPAILGGVVFIRGYNPTDLIRLPVPEDFYCTVVHPHIMVSTKEARDMLPESVSRKDAIRQWGNVGGFVAGLLMDDMKLLGRSVEDAIAEPYRKKFIPGYDALKAELLGAGLLGVNIAGSGPSVFALSDSRSLADRGKEIMERHFALEKIENEIYVTKVGKTGARVVE